MKEDSLYSSGACDTIYIVALSSGHPTQPGVEGVARLAEDSRTRYSAIDPSGHPTHPGVEGVARLAEDPCTIDFFFSFFWGTKPPCFILDFFFLIFLDFCLIDLD